jgi:hypothetical protein
MSDGPVSRYLKIYRRRVSMAERGVTTPAAEVLIQMRSLVTGLEKLPSTTEVRLVQRGRTMRFEVSDGGGLIGSIDL